MTTLQTAIPRDWRNKLDTPPSVEVILRQIALATVITGLIIAAFAALTHQPGDQQPQNQPSITEDWHGNSASIRPVE
jgi:hypothetical protein